ncbi:AEC family transporter [Desulfosporosinus fructosivorans]|uniref:AEC family transporter n=1 Tax=Desulfosporosinus fructosivorans TaxID=2018669 RepID=A0A4Z0R905_9FIRM|nr:AEC family transporter [Desulfosporosinus fructosivorans]TGE39278.1 AEC family transporter [Desulfosporosinus fructosivorans]
MAIFLYILSNNIVPVFIIIGLGFILGKKLDLNLSTLSKLNFYLFVPGFVFFYLYSTSLSWATLKILGFALVYMVINDLLARIMAKIRHYDLGMTNAFKNSIMFNNSGNIGVSLITLVFSSATYAVGGQTPYLNQAIAVQVIIFMCISITMNTIGFYNAGRARKNIRDSLSLIFTMPSIYVVLIALLLKYFTLDITDTPLWPAVGYIKDGLVPVALLSLGVQLSKTEFDFKNVDVNIAVITRLIVGPALAYIGIYLFGFTGVVAQTIFIAYSTPTAVNAALIAVEYDNYQNFAAQEVMMSTIYSAITLTLVIYLARILFPI